MCGICGFFQSKGSADENILKVMNDQIIHRGPDDDGYYYNGRIGLAARRLSIIDLKTGHQPLPSYSRNSWITYNGEVYNFQELREDLISRGYKFRTKTDTEVIVNMYEEFGTDFVKKLRGMFAIGIYDIKNDKLILARDHIGIKPLHYTLDKKSGSLVFGSEIKSILKYPGIKREIDHTGLDMFLSLEYIPAPISIFTGIKKLPAGHILIYQENKLSIKQYWEVEKKFFSDDPEELKEIFLSLLKESVRMRMISDVPLGAFLSGGIDSSAIVAMMAGLSDRKIKTFSIGFEEKSYSELKYSKIISEKFGTDHYT
ncbi:MAG: asparagine synthase (glutamine-hydrolyzing), partial [Candidatus Aminicenantes bacterium]|nr:asparagine synthase (glutamine-hydrolyzing) [Candidatus Aminicenantes bacterium]